MDLNYFMLREQVERRRADSSDHDAVRAAHLELADLYRRQIDDYRSALGVEPQRAQLPHAN